MIDQKVLTDAAKFPDDADALQDLQARVSELELTVDALIAAFKATLDTVDRLNTAQLATKRPSNTPPAGGEYRDRLLTLFAALPVDAYRTPGDIARAFELSRGHAVGIGQACKGLTREGLLVSRTNAQTGRPEYKKA